MTAVFKAASEDDDENEEEDDVEIGCLAWFCSRSSGFRDRRAPDYTTRQMKMVAREGSAPPIAGCRPAVMLFHHRAVEARLAKIGCRGWIRTNTAAFKGRCPTN